MLHNVNFALHNLKNLNKIDIMQILPFNLKYYTNIFPRWYLPLMAKMPKTHGIIFNVAFKTALKTK